MKSRWFTRQLPALIWLGALLLMTGCDEVQEQYHEGQNRAERDAANGELNVALADGTHMAEYPEYTSQLKLYGIHVIICSLPANPPAAAAWARGYNEVSSAKIADQLGTNFLKQTLADARKLHKN